MGRATEQIKGSLSKTGRDQAARHLQDQLKRSPAFGAFVESWRLDPPRRNSTAHLIERLETLRRAICRQERGQERLWIWRVESFKVLAKRGTNFQIALRCEYVLGSPRLSRGNSRDRQPTNRSTVCCRLAVTLDLECYRLLFGPRRDAHPDRLAAPGEILIKLRELHRQRTIAALVAKRHPQIALSRDDADLLDETQYLFDFVGNERISDRQHSCSFDIEAGDLNRDPYEASCNHEQKGGQDDHPELDIRPWLLNRSSREPDARRAALADCLLALLAPRWAARRIPPSGPEEPRRPRHRRDPPDLPSHAPPDVLKRGARPFRGKCRFDPGRPAYRAVSRLDCEQAAGFSRADAQAALVQQP